MDYVVISLNIVYPLKTRLNLYKHKWGLGGVTINDF
jgi:hypothetical protein